jgi:hypothetical protein
VISIAREPEGLPRVIMTQMQDFGAVLRSRALRFAATDPALPAEAGQHG